jgi:hypothetical protein
MTTITSHLGEALAYQDYLPVSWQLPEAELDPARFLALNEHNEEILLNILRLEKHYSDLVDDDTDRFATELAHVDFKLNLLLDLMVQVFSQQLNIPPECGVSLTSSRLQWNSTQAPQLGDELIVEMYLSRRFPRPLKVYGRISSVEMLEKGGFKIILDFGQLSLPVQNLLERFIFLKHRRMVASTRRE